MGERQVRSTETRSATRVKPERFGRLQVAVAEQQDYSLVTVAGEIDVTTSSQLRDPLHELVDRARHHHVVDLREVTFLDSTGLGILVSDHKRVRDQGGVLLVVCPPGLVSRVFRLTGVDRVVPLHDSVDSALAELDKRRGEHATRSGPD